MKMITISMSIIGVAMNVLLNNYILRRARFMIAIGISLTFNVVAFYMHNEPDTIYTVMVLAGIVMTYVLIFMLVVCLLFDEVIGALLFGIAILIQSILNTVLIKYFKNRS